MAKQIYVNVPVRDLAQATAFYEALGFVQQPAFSNDSATGLKWSDEIYVMLLTHDFYKQFLRYKEVADVSTTSGALLALSFESKEEVQAFADTAKQNGGDYFRVDMGIPDDMMFGYEVVDPDGNQWEPMWMNPEFTPHG